MAEARSAAAPAIRLSPETLEIVRKREGLQLSRIRVVHELESVQNPRYKTVLNKALAELDAQIAALGE